MSGSVDVVDNYDLLEQIGLPIEEALSDDMVSSLSDKQWCEKGFYQLDPSEALSFGWNEFVNTVKHKSRYVFYWRDDERSELRGYEEIPPSAFLDALCNTIESLGLYKTVKINTILYRVRIHDSKEKLILAKELASPPPENAIYPNRMSLSGIPMFYGAYDIRTSINETYSIDEKDKVASVAKFRLLKNLTFINLSKLPKVLGLFSGCKRESRHAIIFLKDFIVDITASIKKDGREHIEYVPTQIISEHLRYIHKLNNGTKIDGIIYPSSKNKGKNAVVIFCENEHCVEKAQGSDESLMELEHIRRYNPNNYV